MGTYAATITWHRNEAVFTDKRYSRAHTWQFDGGCIVPASSSPHIVPLPYSDAAAVVIRKRHLWRACQVVTC